MATMTATPPPQLAAPPGPRRTMADVLRELGDIPLDRVRADPPPGTATKADFQRLQEQFRCELVNGTIVELPVGYRQDDFGFFLAMLLAQFVQSRRLGTVITPSGHEMSGGNQRQPDASFTRSDRLPAERPEVSADWCPDLCVEVLSPSNTAAEMAIKRAEYFASGCRLVWEIDIELRAVEVFASAGAPATRLGAGDTLDGGDVLPGFALPLAELWAEWDAAWPGR